ncbi:MAG: hypothetical protein AAFZ09_20075, partial [Pseudomonadota bacterium]
MNVCASVREMRSGSPFFIARPQDSPVREGPGVPGGGPGEESAMDRICIAAAGSTRALMADGPGDVLIVTFD